MYQSSTPTKRSISISNDLVFMTNWMVLETMVIVPKARIKVNKIPNENKIDLTLSNPLNNSGA